MGSTFSLVLRGQYLRVCVDPVEFFEKDLQDMVLSRCLIRSDQLLRSTGALSVKVLLKRCSVFNCVTDCLSILVTARSVSDLINARLNSTTQAQGCGKSA